MSENSPRLKTSLEEPVTVRFAEDHIDVWGLPGGLLRVPVGGSLTVTLDGYVVNVTLEKREDQSAATPAPIPNG